MFGGAPPSVVGAAPPSVEGTSTPSQNPATGVPTLRSTSAGVAGICAPLSSEVPGVSALELLFKAKHPMNAAGGWEDAVKVGAEGGHPRVQAVLPTSGGTLRLTDLSVG